MVGQINELNKKPNNVAEQKLNKILTIVSKEKSLTTKIIEFSEKLFVPILLGILTYVTSVAGNQISEAQNNIAKAQLELAKTQRVDNLQTKYIEIFYRDITSQDAQKQKDAVSFGDVVSDDVAAPLLLWATNRVEQGAKSQVDTAIQNILSRQVQTVNQYKIQVFYNSNKPEQQRIAQEIKQALKGAGVTSVIEVKPQNLNLYTKADFDVIRYYAQNETDVANALQTILRQKYSARSFNLQPVNTPSPGSVSIWIKTNR